jgi:O-antigen/teichoic acid export membrane protein
VGACLLGAQLIASRWIRLASLDAYSAADCIRLLGVGALLALPRSLHASLLRGLQEMGMLNLIETGLIAVQQVGWLLILQHGGGLLPISAWYALTQVLGVIAYLLALRRFLPLRAFMPGYSAEVLKGNRAFAVQAMWTSVLASLHSQSDKLLVSKLMPVAALGMYGFAWALVAGMSRVSFSVVQAAYPALAGLAREGRPGDLIRQYYRLNRLVMVATGPCYAALVFASFPIFSYAFGQQAAGSLLIPTVLLCTGSYLNGTLGIPYVLSLAVGRPDIAARQNQVALLVVLPVTVAGVFRFGLAGAAFGWLFYQCFAYVYGVPRIRRQCLDLPPWSWARELLPVVVVLLGLYVPAYLLAWGGGGSRPVWLGLAFLSATVPYALYAWAALRGHRPVSVNSLRKAA